MEQEMSPKCMMASLSYAGLAVNSCRTVLMANPGHKVELSYQGKERGLRIAFVMPEFVSGIFYYKKFTVKWLK